MKADTTDGGMCDVFTSKYAYLRTLIDSTFDFASAVAGTGT